MTRISAPALVLALAFAYACAPKVNDPADIEAIKQLMDGYFKAANAKDSSALDAALTDRTVLLEPHMKPLVGKEALGKMHQAFLVEAMKNRDMAFFERHAAKEYVQVTDGKPVNFAAQLAGLKSGLLRIETAALRT